LRSRVDLNQNHPNCVEREEWMRRRLWSWGAGLVLAVVSSATLRGTTYTVHVGGVSNTFTPATQSIFVGDTIHWVWDGGFHSTTSGTCSALFTCTGDGIWDSGITGTIGNTFDFTFSTAGTFPYYCRQHLGMMTGTIVVKPPAQYHTVTPCRVADTRGAAGPYGGPSLAGGGSRTFVIAGQCGVPPTASSVSFNFTVTNATGDGDLRVIPADQSLPVVSTLNWRAGQTRANNATVGLGAAAGDILVRVDQAGGTVDLVIDVNGYFE